jgi:hypothetical protein
MKHAVQKAMQRHGVNINMSDLLSLRKNIEHFKNIKAWFYKNGHPTHTEKWIVNYKNELWYLVYDPRSRKIVTILDDAHPEIVKRVVGIISGK